MSNQVTPLFRDAGPPAAESSTPQLVAAAVGGSAQAAAKLYQAHFEGLFRSAYYMVGERAAAEDLAQEAFAQALTRLRTFDPQRAQFSTWLFAIAQNLVRKHWRKSARRSKAYGRLEGTPEAPAADPEVAHVKRLRFEALRQALDTLPEPLREAFVLVDMQGLSGEDAAVRLGISPGNLRVRTSRARTRIRRELAKQGWLEGGSA